MAPNIGFIGLGNMGYGMARNIRRNLPEDATLYIMDVYRPTCDSLVAELLSNGKIIILDTPREMAERADVIISIVPAGEQVRAVYLDPESGVIAAKRDPDRLLLDCTTIDPADSREVGKKIAEGGAGVYVDAPVSGGPPKANAGTLAFLIGQPPPETDSSTASRTSRIKSILTMMGDPSKFFFCGAPSSGLAAKLANNYLCGTILLATAEAMAIGIKSGIDKHLLYDVIHNCTGQSFMHDNWNPVPGVLPQAPASNQYRPGAKTPIMVKDMILATDMGRDVGIRTRAGDVALEVFREAAVDPRALDCDMSIIYRLMGGPE